MLRDTHIALQRIVDEQLAPFSQGIDDALLERAFNTVRLRRSHRSDVITRFRVISNRLFMNKRGRCIGERHTHFIHGLLTLLETHDTPDVDFIMSMDDNPPCEAADEPLPIGTFGKYDGCSSMLLPCWSMMQQRSLRACPAPNATDSFA
mmetsp:Transcript_25301/g.57634  ORF Transcript_25301/g.57634 Transcript_25301/m.57634 type:complete len:149 (-) Transcript_25301:1316-1762(-)